MFSTIRTSLINFGSFHCLKLHHSHSRSCTTFGWKLQKIFSEMATTGKSEAKVHDYVKLESSSGAAAECFPVFTNLETYPPNSFKEFMNNIDVVMFDCDGVLWLGNSIIKNAPTLVIKLREMGKRVYFVTNNSTKTREEFLQKFDSLGFEATLNEIVSSSYLAALYLTERKFDSKVYVIGTTGITRELSAVGIRTLPIGVDLPKDSDVVWGTDDEAIHEFDPEVGAVVVGFDNNFNYKKLVKAATYLNNPDCIFIATNTDERFPSPNNIVIPGTGAVVSAVKTAAEREPVVMGKPSKTSFDLINKKFGLNPRRTLMIGDRANTDILFGTKCDMWTLLVLSGVTTIREITSWIAGGDREQQQLVPNFYLNEVNDLYKLIQKHKL